MDEPVRLPIEDALDLHAFHPRDVKSVVDEYVTAAHEAGLREVRLVHGRGTGVQRGIVQAALERHPLVRGVPRRARLAPRRHDRHASRTRDLGRDPCAPASALPSRVSIRRGSHDLLSQI